MENTVNTVNAENKPREEIENYCPQCRRELTGAIETSEGVVGALRVIVMEETSDRNWIVCDSCNKTLCKSCCIKPDSGYCDNCFYEYQIAPFIP